MVEVLLPVGELLELEREQQQLKAKQQKRNQQLSTKSRKKDEKTSSISPPSSLSSSSLSSVLSLSLSLSPPQKRIFQVYVTMYLNDHARSPFYESLGLNTKQFNQHVIIETNKTTERIFPEVPDVEDPAFFPRLDRMVAMNERLAAIGCSDAPGLVKTLQKVPILASFVGELLAMFFSPVKATGSADLVPEVQAVY